jgi:hypothetical protein
MPPVQPNGPEIFPAPPIQPSRTCPTVQQFAEIVGFEFEFEPGRPARMIGQHAFAEQSAIRIELEMVQTQTCATATRRSIGEQAQMQFTQFATVP